MTTGSRADLRRRYREEGPPLGVHAVRNSVDGWMLVGSSRNPPFAENALRFRLRLGSHRDRALQADGKAHGEGALTGEVPHERRPGPGVDVRGALDALERSWLDEFQPYGERGYDRPSRAGAA